MQSVVFPGSRIASVADGIAGDGAFIHGDFIYASRLGHVIQIPPSSSSSSSSSTDKTEYHVARDKATPVPRVNSIVMGKISKMTSQYANVDVMIVDGEPSNEPFNATIRKQDVRSFDKDAVDLGKCFVPGDIIKAEVISLGDAHSYYLSTAKNEYGVVYAESKIAGAQMVPISWEEMQCIKTGSREFRKCITYFLICLFDN